MVRNSYSFCDFIFWDLETNPVSPFLALLLILVIAMLYRFLAW
jgi:hypothetical protein